MYMFIPSVIAHLFSQKRLLPVNVSVRCWSSCRLCIYVHYRDTWRTRQALLPLIFLSKSITVTKEMEKKRKMGKNVASVLKHWHLMVLYWKRGTLLTNYSAQENVATVQKYQKCSVPGSSLSQCSWVLQTRLFQYSKKLLSTTFSYFCRWQGHSDKRPGLLERVIQDDIKESGEKYFLASLGIWAMLGCSKCFLANQQRGTGQKDRLELPSSSHF